MLSMWAASGSDDGLGAGDAVCHVGGGGMHEVEVAIAGDDEGGQVQLA